MTDQNDINVKLTLWISKRVNEGWTDDQIQMSLNFGKFIIRNGSTAEMRGG